MRLIDANDIRLPLGCVENINGRLMVPLDVVKEAIKNAPTKESKDVQQNNNSAQS